MLAYDPASNLTEWVPMQGVSLSLTSTELKSANNLSNIFPCPHPEAIPPSSQSARQLHCLLVGEETDSDTEGMDSEEWDQLKHNDWSCCMTPPLEKTLMWNEVTSKPPRRQNQCLILECDNEESEEWESDDPTKDQQGECYRCSKCENTQNLPNDE